MFREERMAGAGAAGGHHGRRVGVPQVGTRERPGDAAAGLQVAGEQAANVALLAAAQGFGEVGPPGVEPGLRSRGSGF